MIIFIVFSEFLVYCSTCKSTKSQLCFELMIRLNSGILKIFEPSEWNLNLNSSDCRTSKIIQNDTELEPISWEPNRKNSLFNSCVGVWVGGHARTHLLMSMPPWCVMVKIWFWMKNRPKIENYGGWNQRDKYLSACCHIFIWNQPFASSKYQLLPSASSNSDIVSVSTIFGISVIKSR